MKNKSGTSLSIVVLCWSLIDCIELVISIKNLFVEIHRARTQGIVYKYLLQLFIVEVICLKAIFKWQKSKAKRQANYKVFMAYVITFAEQVTVDICL